MASKAEMKALARTTVEKASETIADVLGWVSGERSKVEQRLGRYEVLAAIALSEGMDAKDVLGGKETAMDWAAKRMPGASKATLYRWRNAGDVARVLRGNGTETEPDLLGDLPTAMVGSLVPLYRVLDLRAKADEARTRGRVLARETYKGLLDKAETMDILTREGETVQVKVAPTFPEVLAAAEKASPSNRSGGGKKKAESDEADEAETDGTETEETETDETRRESSAGLVQVDAVAVEAASGPTGAILAGLVREHDGLTEATARAVGLAVLRLAEAHGIGPVRAVLSGIVPSAEAEAEKAETEKDEKAVEAEAEKVAA